MPQEETPRPKIKNERLANLISGSMAEYLLARNPIFEEMSLGDIEGGIGLIREHGSILENTEHSFVISYSIESEGSSLGISKTLLRGHAYDLRKIDKEQLEALSFFRDFENARFTENYGWYFTESLISPPPRLARH